MKNQEMQLDDLKNIVIKKETSDVYYRELNDLKSDINFFNLFMKRDKKSVFDFTVRVRQGCSFNAFDALWKRYGYGDSYIEDAYAEFKVLKILIEQIYDEKDGPIPNNKLQAVIHYYEKYDDFNVEDYVGDFIGCSHGCSCTMSTIQKIRKGEE